MHIHVALAAFSLVLILGLSEEHNLQPTRKNGFPFYHDDETTALITQERAAVHSRKERAAVHSRKERSIASIGKLLRGGAKIVSKAFDLGSHVYNLGNALTDGCMSYKNLCKNKKKMEELDEEIGNMQRELDRWNCDGKMKFLGDLYQNNALLQRRLNKIINEYNTIAEFELHNIDVVVGENASYQWQYVKEMSKLKFTLANIDEELHIHKVTTLSGTALGFAVEFSISRISKAFSKHYKNEWQKFVDKVMYNNPAMPDIDIDKLRNGKTKGLKQFMQKFKTGLKAIGLSVKGGLKSGIHAPGKIKHAFQFHRDTLDKIRFRILKNLKPFKSKHNFINSIKKSLNKKLTKTRIFLGGTGKAVSAISIYLTHKTFKDLERKTSEALRDAEIERDNLKKKLSNCKQVYSKTLTEMFDNFTSIAARFQTVMLHGVQGVEINIAKILFPDLNFIDVSHYLTKDYFGNESTIKDQQHMLLSVLNNQSFDLKNVKDILRASALLNEQTKELVSENRSFQTIRELINLIYDTQESTVVKKYGRAISIGKLLCAITLVQMEEEMYDFFNLSAIRDNCTTNPSFISINRVMADRLKEIIERKIRLNVENGHGVSAIHDNIRRTLSGDTYMTFPYDSVPTHKDILCQITAMYPTKLTYDFYDLQHFKTHCLNMSKSNFKQLQKAAFYERKKAEFLKFQEMYRQ